MTELPLIVIDVQRAGPSTGHADQDRAGRPAAGDVRPQRRVAGAGDRRPVAPSDCFDTAIEAVADRRQVPDAGDRAVRRLHRQRRRAVARCPTSPRSRRSTRGSRPRPTHRRRGQAAVPALPARPGDARPAVGGAGHRPGCSTGSAASRRRATPARSPTTRPTTRRWSAPVRPRSTASCATSPTWWSTTRPARTAATPGCWCSAGARRTGRSPRPSGACANTGRQVAQTHLRHLNPFPANLGAVLRRYDRVIVPEMNLGQLALLLRGEVPGRRPQLLPGPRAADLAQRARPRPRARDRRARRTRA